MGQGPVVHLHLSPVEELQDSPLQTYNPPLAEDLTLKQTLSPLLLGLSSHRSVEQSSQPLEEQDQHPDALLHQDQHPDALLHQDQHQHLELTACLEDLVSVFRHQSSTFNTELCITSSKKMPDSPAL